MGSLPAMKTTSFDPQAYEIAIRRVVEDGEVLFKGTVKELADVEVYEKNQRAAYDAVVCVIRELHKQALDHGRPFPEPSEVQEEFSGRITLRLTKTVHRQVALAAEREGVSLNHFISTVVSTYVGALFGGYPSHAPTFVHPVDGAVQRARMLSGTGTTWVVQGKAVRFPGET